MWSSDSVTSVYFHPEVAPSLYEALDALMFNNFHFKVSDKTKPLYVYASLHNKDGMSLFYGNANASRSENGLLVCQLGVGIWRFDSNMLPTHLIHSPDHKHHHLANIAAGGPDLKTLYITESLSGDILVAKLPVAGKKLFAHQ